MHSVTPRVCVNRWPVFECGANGFRASSVDVCENSDSPAEWHCPSVPPVRERCRFQSPRNEQHPRIAFRPSSPGYAAASPAFDQPLGFNVAGRDRTRFLCRVERLRRGW